MHNHHERDGFKVKKFAAIVLAVVMPFSNPIIGGNNTLIRDDMTSEGYVAGSSGWRIARDGTAEFNDLTSRGTFISGNGTGQHIEINGNDAPNGVAFYTGDANETFPGVIQPEPNADALSITMASPLTAGHSGSSFSLNTGLTGADKDYLDMNSQNFSVNVSSNLALNGPGYGGGGSLTYGLITSDGTGPYWDFNAPRIFLRDTDSSNSNGLIVQGTTISVISETWHNITKVNSWVDFAGARANYYIDATGRVQLRGQVASGTATLIGTLPVGYRPTQTMEWVMRAVGGVTLCAVSVSTAGAITVTANAATAQASGIKLDAISFPTF